MKKSTTKQDLKELEDYEKRVKEYTNARLQRTGNKPHLPNPREHGINSCGCQICKRTYTNIEETNAKIKPPLEFEAAIIARKAIDLLVKKHNDYGPSNISDAPGGPLNGLSVRLHDKVARLNNLLSKKSYHFHFLSFSLISCAADIINITSGNFVKK